MGIVFMVEGFIFNVGCVPSMEIKFYVRVGVEVLKIKEIESIKTSDKACIFQKAIHFSGLWHWSLTQL